MEFDYNFTLLFMIFMRMSGCILFNPVLGRKNIPGIVRAALSMVLTLFAYRLVPAQGLHIDSLLVFVLCALKELAVGFILGYVIQLFLSVFIMSGEMMDMQIGISMSHVYDPQSNISMPLSASLINAMFILIFFASNGHLTLIRLFTKLCEVVPYGDGFVNVNTDVWQSLVAMFSLILIYSVKLSMPVVAVQLISEIGVGIIMRAVPQIDVFVVQIQLKVLIGFLSILILVPSFASFLEKLIDLMFDNLTHILTMLAG